MRKTDLLFQYLDGANPSFGWTKIQDSPFSIYKLVSQTWRSLPWVHRVWQVQPENLAPGNLAVLYLTGDEVFENDFAYVKRLADATGCVVYTVFGIPNQPIWDMREDDLIGHTFDRFIESGEEDWPLLFPMTKAAISALDMATDLEKARGNSVPEFLVCGASKRGWTTWLTAASKDPRIAGIAPMVFDFLNFGEQLKSMERDWDGYSPMHEDYSKRQLQDLALTERGRQLVQEVDPFTYRENFTLPKLIISGSNDPFWHAESAHHYASDLSGETSFQVIPNAGHEMGDGKEKFAALGLFSESLRRKMPMPILTTSIEKDTYSIQYGPEFKSIKIWAAESPTAWIADQEFKVIHEFSNLDTKIISLKIPKSSSPQAIFAQATLESNQTLTTPMSLIRR